jgi:hypothetical protein
MQTAGADLDLPSGMAELERMLSAKVLAPQLRDQNALNTDLAFC